MRIAVIANSAWYLYNFRRQLVRALAEAGHDVVTISPADAYAKRLVDEGFAHQTLALSASGTNPLRELAAVVRLRRLLKQGRFEAALTYTPKVNIYTGLAVRGLHIGHLPNVSGLGRVFIRPTLLTPIVRALYRFAFKRASKVVFQNQDDRDLFVELGLVSREATVRVPGSGVDLNRFQPSEDRAGEPTVTFLLVARMLWDKGVGEYVQAARMMRRDCPQARFLMLGSSASDNPAAVPLDTLRSWQEEGVVTYFDYLDDVRPVVEQAQCVVLPSYREGVPRSLLEAAAMGKPLIASDAPGCRDAVDDGVNGFLCRVGDAASLEATMRRFMTLKAQEQRAMGRRSRKKVETQFDERIVLSTYFVLLNQISITHT